MSDQGPTVHGAGRVLAGVICIAWPTRVQRLWLGTSQPGANRVLMRAVGARDIGIGIGLTTASRPGSVPWLLAGVLCDAVDLIATYAARRELPRSGLVFLTTVAVPSIVWQSTLIWRERR